MGLKAVGRLILSAVFAVLTGLLMAAAKAAPDAIFGFYTDFSMKIQNFLTAITGWMPFALWEILAILLLLLFVYTLIRAISKVKIVKWLTGVLLTACILAFAFVGFWGLHHFGPTVDQKLGLQVREYSKQELIDATTYYANQANALADTVQRDTDGCARFDDFKTLAEKANAGYRALAEQYPFFGGKDQTVKKLLFDKLYSRMGSTGVYVCLTAEACVNPDTHPVWLPFTMCHELAHGKTIAAEDGCNFCAYLACMQNPDPQFRYSGAVAAVTYCNNALNEIDPAAAEALWMQVDPGVIADLNAANTHYEQYEGKVQDTAQKVNDAYLKAFSENEGVQSYGKAADLLIAWYQQNFA